MWREVAILLASLVPIAFPCDEFWILKKKMPFRHAHSKALVLMTKAIVPNALHMRCVDVMPRNYSWDTFNVKPRMISKWKFGEGEKSEF